MQLKLQYMAGNIENGTVFMRSTCETETEKRQNFSHKVFHI